VGLESQLRHIRTGQGTRTGRAKLPKIQSAIAWLRRVIYPVARCGETKIVASSIPGFPPDLEATV
jgi:hypothetical protein